MPELINSSVTPLEINQIDLNSYLNKPILQDTTGNIFAQPIKTSSPFDVDLSQYQPTERGFDARELKTISGYDSFKTNPIYNPEISSIDNLRGYAAKQGTGEWLANSGVKLWKTTASTFVNSFQQDLRNVQALTNWDANKLISTEDNSKEQERLTNLYPTLGTGELDNSWKRFIPTNFGKSDFGGQMLDQLGFSLGTMGAALAQNFIIEAATGFAGTGLAAAKDAFALGKIGKGFYNLFEFSNGVTNFKRGLNILNSIEKEATFGGSLVKGAKGLANMYSMYTTAASEAGMEGNNIYNSHLNDLTQQYIDKNGYKPFGKDLEDIKKSAMETGLTTFGWNMPILLASNLIQFGNILKPFKGAEADLLKDVAYKITGKGLGATITRAAEKEVESKLSKILGGIEKYSLGLVGEEPLSEGFQEISQSFVSTGADTYYKNLYNGLSKGTAMNKAMDAMWNYAGTAAYYNDFFGGYIGGAVFNTASQVAEISGFKDTALGKQITGGSEKAKEAAKEAKIDEFAKVLQSVSTEDLAKWAYSPEVTRFFSQTANTLKMDRAVQDKDILSFNDGRSDSVRDAIYYGLQTGKLDLILSQFDVLPLLDNEDLVKVRETGDKSTDAEAKERVTKLVNDVKERALSLQSDYNTLNQKYVNPYEKNSLEHERYELAKKERLFTKDAVEQDRKKSNELRNDITTNTAGNLTYNIIDQGVDNTILNKQIEDLDYFIKNAPDKSDPTFSLKEKQLSSLKEIKKEKSKKSPDFDVIAQHIFDIGQNNGPETNYFSNVTKEPTLKKISDVLKIEARNKLNIAKYNYLNNRPIEDDINLFTQAENIIIAAAKKQANKEIEKPEDIPFIEVPKSTDFSSSLEKLGKGYNIKEISGKIRLVYNSNTGYKTLDYNTIEELNLDIPNILEKFKESFPSSEELLETSPAEMDKIQQRELKDNSDVGRTKDISILPFTTTEPTWEEQTPETEYLHRQQYFFNNIFYSKTPKNLNLQAIPVTSLNVRNVEVSLNLPEQSLQYLIDPSFDISKDINGHITIIYANKLSENQFELIDEQGNPIKDNFSDKIVQGRLVTSDENALKGKIRENTTQEEITQALNKNKEIRTHLIKDNSFQVFPFTFSKGLSTLPNIPFEQSKRSVASANLIDVNNLKGSIHIPTLGSGKRSQTIEGDLLIIGRPYLRIEGRNADGSKLVKYQYLDNTNLSIPQKEGINKAIQSLKDKTLNKTLQSKGDLENSEEYKYLSGVLQLTTNSNISSPRQLFLSISNNILDIKFQETDFNTWLNSRYHNINNSLFSKPFKDFSDGASYKSYEAYLLTSNNPPLTVRISNFTPENSPELPFVQRYAIIDFSPITGSKPQASPKKILNSSTKSTPKKQFSKTEDEEVFVTGEYGEKVAIEKEQFSTDDNQIVQLILKSIAEPGIQRDLRNPKSKWIKIAIQRLGLQNNLPKTPAEAAKILSPAITPTEWLIDKLQQNDEDFQLELSFIPTAKGEELEQFLKDTLIPNPIKNAPLEEIKPIVILEEVPAGITKDVTVVENISKNIETKEDIENKIKAAEKLGTLDNLVGGVNNDISGAKNKTYRELYQEELNNLKEEIPEIPEPSEKAKEAASIVDDLFDEEKEEKAPFKLEDINNTEPITEEELQDFKRMLSQVELNYNPALSRLFGNRRVWGAYKNKIVSLYQGANKGTAHHEAFEVIFNSILTKSQQRGLLDEFKNRIGSFTTFEGINKGYKAATDLEAKEAIADEFIDFKNNKAPTSNIQKNFFQKLWDFIKNFINKFITNSPLRNLTTPSISEVYTKLDNGYYNNIKLRDSFTEYFKLGDLTEYEKFAFQKSFSARLFNKILNDRKDILRALDEKNISEVELYNILFEDVTKYFSNRTELKANINSRVQYLQIKDKNLSLEDARNAAKEEFRSAIHKWEDNIKTNKNEFIQGNKNYLNGFGIKFEDLNIDYDTEVFEENEKEGTKDRNDYVRDYLSIDVKNKIPASIKLIIATLIDSIAISSEQNIDLISDVTSLPTTLVNYNSVFNRLLNHLIGLNTPERIKNKLLELSKPSAIELANINTPASNIRAQFKKLHDAIFTQDFSQIDNRDALNLVYKLTFAFSKQKPQFLRLKINAETGKTYFVNELFETTSKEFVKNVNNSLRNIQYDKNLSWIKYNYRENFSLIQSKLPQNISTLSSNEDFSDNLYKLGIKQFTPEIIKNLSEDDRNSLIQNYLDILGILNRQNIYKGISSSELGIDTPLNAIAEIYANYTFDEANPQHNNSDGKTQQNVIDNNLPSLVLSEINNYENKEDFLKEFPYYNDYFARHSLLLDKLFSIPIERRNKTLTILDGLEFGEEGKTTSALSHAELFMMRLNASLNISKGKKERQAIFPLLENADGNIDWALQIGNYINDPSELPDVLYNHLSDEIAVAIDYITNQTPERKDNEELSKIVTYKNGEKRMKGKSLQFFSGILPIEQLELIYSLIDGSSPSQDIYKDIDEFFKTSTIKEVLTTSFLDFVNQKVEEDFNFMQKNEYIQPNGELFNIFMVDSDAINSEGVSKNEIISLLRNRQINYILHNIEMFKVFFGAPYYYKDPMKRFKSSMSPRGTTIKSKQLDEISSKLLNNVPESDKTFHKFSNEFSFYSVGDIITHNPELSKIFPAFSQNESTDAQMAMMLPYFKELFLKSGGVWTREQDEYLEYETAYFRKQASKKIDTETNSSYYTYSSEELKDRDVQTIKEYEKENKQGYISVIKPILTSTGSGNILEPKLLKTSTLPLTYRLVEGTKLESVFLDLFKDNAAAFSFKSAHKVGQPKTYSPINLDGSIKKLSSISPKETVPFSSFGIQVETQHNSNEQTAGTQIMKKITDDMYNMGVPRDFISTKKADILKLKEWQSLSEEQKRNISPLYSLENSHKNALDLLNNDNYNNFLKKFGIIENSDGSFTYQDKSKLYNTLEKFITKHGVPSHVIDQLQRDENGNVTLELMADFQTMKHIIYSLVDKGVVSPKLNGGQKIQISSGLFDSLDHNYKIYYRNKKSKEEFKELTNQEDFNEEKHEYIIGDTSLKFYQKGETLPDGSIAPTSRMQVKLSSRMRRDINTQRNKRGLKNLSEQELLEWLNKPENKKLLEGVGFRIPTQALSSIDAFEIVGFLPEYLGDAIVVPAELPTKAGSDFDVDKLSTYLNNYLLNSEGLPEYIEFKNSLQETEEFYRNYFKENTQKLLTKYTNEENILHRAKLLEALQTMSLGLDETRELERWIKNHEEKLNRIIEENEGDADLAAERIFSDINRINKRVIDLNDEELQRIEEDSFVSKTVSKAIQNNYFQSIANILLTPSNFEKVLSPNSSDEFINGYTKDIEELKGIEKGIENGFDPTKLLDSGEMIRLRNLFLQAKSAVGISAIGGTSHTNFQKLLSFVQPKKYSPSTGANYIWYEPFINEYTDGIKFKHNTISIDGEQYATLSAITNVEGLNILEYISKLINGSVDVTKDDWMVRWGAFAEALPVVVTAFKLGMSINDVGLLINHPIVKEYMRIKSIIKSPVFKLSTSLQNKYKDISYSDDTYLQYFEGENLLKYNYNDPIENYTSNDISLIKSHIKSAGKDSDFQSFLNEFQNIEYSKALSLSVLRQFLQLKEYSNDIRATVATSNHETVHLKNNYIIPLKEANFETSKNNTIKAYSNNSIIPASVALRENSFVNTIITNLKKTEEFLYSNILLPQTRTIANYITNSLSRDNTRELNLQKVIDTAEDLEQNTWNTFIQSSQIPSSFKGLSGYLKDNYHIFSLNSPIYTTLNNLKEQNLTKSSIDKVKSGTLVLDHISLVPIRNTELFYFSIKNKPKASDIFASNQFYEAIKNLKQNSPEIYTYIMIGSILQSGITFQKDNISNFIPAEDYREIANTINSIPIDDYFLENLKRLFASNFYKTDNAIVTKVEDKITTPFIIDLSNPEYTPLSNNRKGITSFEGEFGPEEKYGSIEKTKTFLINSIRDSNNKFNSIYIFPTKSWRTYLKDGSWITEQGWNKYVQRDFLYWAKGKLANREEFLLENTQIKIKDLNNVEYTVFQHLPSRGVNNRILETSLPDITNPSSFNSQFEQNPKGNYKSQDELIQILSNLYGEDNISIKKEFNTSPTITYSQENNVSLEENKEMILSETNPYPGVVNIPNSGLTVEQSNKFIDLLQSQIANQAYVENKAWDANRMFSFGLRWAKNVPNPQEKSKQRAKGLEQRPNKVKINSVSSFDGYGYYTTDQNNNPLPSIKTLQPIIDFVQSKIGIDMSDYDSVLANIYEPNSYIHQHRDITESRTAKNYPVIVINLGASGGLIYHTEFSDETKYNPNTNTYNTFLVNKEAQANLPIENGGIYAFGVDGINRFTFNHRVERGIGETPTKTVNVPEFDEQGNKIKEKTLKYYRITLTFRRAQDLTSDIPQSPKKLENIQISSENQIPIQITDIQRSSKKQKYNISLSDGTIEEREGYKLKIKEYPEFQGYITGSSKEGWSVNEVTTSRSIPVIGSTIKEILPELVDTLNKALAKPENQELLKSIGIDTTVKAEGLPDINICK